MLERSGVRSRYLNPLGMSVGLGTIPSPVFASDFAALIVVFAAFGIAAILIIQALIGLVLVIDKTYTTKNPTRFVVIACVFLFIGTTIVLSEAAHLNSEDLMVLFGALFIPGAIAILPPLIQRARSKR